MIRRSARKKPIRRAGGAAQNPKYLAFIRGQFCIVPGCLLRAEAAHVGDRGLGQKCRDEEALPICREHHRTGHCSHHRLGRKFWAHHDLDRKALIAGFNREYAARKAA